MRGVLVDTSVWVDHFRRRNDALVDLLGLDAVMVHPLIVGEISCGTPPDRVRTLSDLQDLRQAQQASAREAMDFVERERLFGLGCGWIDMVLLASTMITPGVDLWTMDRRLGALAKRFGVAHPSGVH